jgi:putative DNA primase/helicase
MSKDKKPHHEVVAEKIIEQLEAGTAPWLKPWGGTNQSLPHNPVSGSRYRGANLIWLAARQMESGYTDTRWLTYKQGQSIDAQVRKGEKGTIVQYWQFSDRRKIKDQNGKDLIGNDGKPIYEEYKLQRPRVFSAVVFNASQFDNMPEITPRKIDFNPNEKAEEILTSSGAKIIHDQQDRAFYSSLKDEIHLPDKSQFTNESSYYATALHELGHWTGHESRLGREMEGGFGTPQYAKEELRAEITSMMLGEELGIGHDPGQHVSYIKSS